MIQNVTMWNTFSGKKAREYIADEISRLEVKKGKAWETLTYEDIIK